MGKGIIEVTVNRMDKNTKKVGEKSCIMFGIDIGSTASEIASRLLDEGIDVMSEGVRVAATGYGRVAVDYADFVITEITCHGRGGRELGREMNVQLLMWVVRIRK